MPSRVGAASMSSTISAAGRTGPASGTLVSSRTHCSNQPSACRNCRFFIGTTQHT